MKLSVFIIWGKQEVVFVNQTKSTQLLQTSGTFSTRAWKYFISQSKSGQTQPEQQAPYLPAAHLSNEERRHAKRISVSVEINF